MNRLIGLLVVFGWSWLVWVVNRCLGAYGATQRGRR